MLYVASFLSRCEEPQWTLILAQRTGYCKRSAHRLFFFFLFSTGPNSSADSIAIIERSIQSTVTVILIKAVS